VFTILLFCAVQTYCQNESETFFNRNYLPSFLDHVSSASVIATSEVRWYLIISMIMMMIIIIFIIIISFMQSIYTYIPETNYVSRE